MDFLSKANTAHIHLREKFNGNLQQGKKKWDCALLLFALDTKSLETYALKTQISSNSSVNSSNPLKGWEELNHGQHAWPQALSL